MIPPAARSRRTNGPSCFGELAGSAGQAQRAGLACDLELLLDRDRHALKRTDFVAAPHRCIRLRDLTASVVEERDRDGVECRVELLDAGEACFYASAADTCLPRMKRASASAPTHVNSRSAIVATNGILMSP